MGDSNLAALTDILRTSGYQQLKTVHPGNEISPQEIIDEVKRPPGVMVFSEDWEAMALLPPEESMRLLSAMFLFATQGVTPQFDENPRLHLLWPSRAARIDRDVAKYNNEIKQCSNAGKASGEARRKSTTVERPLNDR